MNRTIIASACLVSGVVGYLTSYTDPATVLQNRRADLAAEAAGYETSQLSELEQHDAMFQLYARWTAEDPVGALASVPDEHVLLLLEAWASHDLTGAVEAARSFGEPVSQEFFKRLRPFRSGLFALMTAAEIDPARDLENPSNRWDPFGEADSPYTRLRQKFPHPGDALDAILKVEKIGERDDLLAKFIANLSPRDASALPLIEKLLIDSGDTKLPEVLSRLYSFSGRMVSDNPGKSLRWLEQLPEFEGKQGILEAGARQVANDYPEEFFSHLDRLGWKFARGRYSGSSDTALKSLMHKGGIESALQQIAKMPGENWPQSGLKIILGSWAKTNPQEALGFLENLPESFDARSLTAGVVKAIAQTDIETLEKTFPTLTDQGLELAVGEKIAQELLAESPEAAMVWWDGLSPEQKPMFTRAMESGFIQSPIGFSERVGLLDRYPTIFGTPAAYEWAARSWVRSSPVDASTWVGSLPRGDSRDSAISGMVQSLMKELEPDTASVAAWISLISNPELREKSFNQIALSPNL